MNDEVRLNDMTFGSLCRIGLVLSVCFWLPAGIVLGLAALGGAVEVDWMGKPATGLAGLVTCIVQGLGGALLTASALALGALVLRALGSRWRGPRLSLRREQ